MNFKSCVPPGLLPSRPSAQTKVTRVDGKERSSSHLLRSQPKSRWLNLAVHGCELGVSSVRTRQWWQQPLHTHCVLTGHQATHNKSYMSRVTTVHFVLYSRFLPCSLRRPLATGGDRALKVLPVQTTMCRKGKIHTRFRRLSMTRMQSISLIFFILIMYWNDNSLNTLGRIYY